MPQAAGVEIRETAESVIVSAAAGHDWHRLVEFAVAHGWGGIENLSLIPGAVGAAPIQNVGAYGAQLSDVFVDLEAVPLDGGEPRTMDADACAFGYRDSVFKQALRDTMLITRVRLRLHRRPRLNLEYAGVREELARDGGDRADGGRREPGDHPPAPPQAARSRLHSPMPVPSSRTPCSLPTTTLRYGSASRTSPG